MINHQNQIAHLNMNSASSSSLSSSSTLTSQSLQNSQPIHTNSFNKQEIKSEDNHDKIKFEDKDIENHNNNDLEIEKHEQMQQKKRQEWLQQYEEKQQKNNIHKRKLVYTDDNIDAYIGGINNYELYYDEDENGIMNEEDLKKMHYGVVKMKTNQRINTEQEFICQNENSSYPITNEEMLLQHFVMKKTIAKMKKNSSKKFIKKTISIQPIFFKEITCHNKFMIFGFQQVEQFYRDFDDQNDGNLILQCRYVVDVNRLVNNIADNLIEVYFNVKGRSGLTDFRFLIDHYCKQPEKYYHELGELLKKYQQLVSISVSHMSHINRMIRFQMLTEDEISLAFAQSEIYFNNYIKLKYRTNPKTNNNYSDYLMYTTVRSNFNTLDLDVYSNIFTKQMFELLGYNSSVLEILSAINTPFQMPQGDTRLNDITNLIKIYVSQQSFQNLPITFYTQDGLQVTTTLDCEIINYPHSPEWMIPLDTFVILIKFNLTQREISQVQSYRSPQKQITSLCQMGDDEINKKQTDKNQNSKINNGSYQTQQQQQQQQERVSNELIESNTSILHNYADSQYQTEKFEYIMQSELFLEKFYPNHSQEQIIQEQPIITSNTSIKKQNNKKTTTKSQKKI